MVRSGLDSLASSGFAELRGKRLGVLVNQASVDSQFRHLVDLLCENGCTPVRIFVPEHGLRGALQDMVSVDHSTDPKTKLPVVSLYGNSAASLRPKAEQIQDLEIVVCDMSDIGSRYYTFAQTLAYLMEVAGKCGVKVMVLDRPNPIGGLQLEGGPVTRDCRSFCGLYSVANRHGLTLGELGTLMQRGFGRGDDALPGISCDLSVVKVEGWSREMYFGDTGLPWVAPSPNMPTPDTALVYPGTCLFEGTNISEGRGTTRPFELLGAPFIDGGAWAEAAYEQGITLEGVALRPVSFIPQFHKWQQKSCSGVQVHVTDRKKFRPLRVSLALIGAVAKLYPKEFSWRREAYEFVENVSAIDLLFGSAEFRRAVETKSSLQKIETLLVEYEDWYRQARQSFLLY